MAGCPGADDDDSALDDDDATGDDDDATGDDDDATGDDDDSALDDDDATGDDDDATGDDDTAPEWFGLDGALSRTAEIQEGGDGIGTVCLGILEDCQIGAAVAYGAQLDGIDLSDPATPVPFGFSAPNGAMVDGVTYHLGAYFVDDGAIDCEIYVPEGGELYSTACPSFVFETSGQALGLEVVLDSALVL